MKVGSRQGAVNARALVSSAVGGVRVEPRPLTDGRFALPDMVFTNPAYAAALPALGDWATETPAAADYLAVPASNGDSRFYVKVGPDWFWCVSRRAGLTMPASDVFRFEVRTNDFGYVDDSPNAKRRNEIILANGESAGVHSGDTIWSAFCLIMGDHPGLSEVTSNFQGYVHQWHSVDTTVGRSPGLCVDVSNNTMRIQTRSSAALGGASGFNGVPTNHYTTDIPAKGVKTYFVLQATWGQTGHLNAWVNGTQVVNGDTPIGYYDDLTDGSGRTVLGYPHWGLYAKNQPKTDIVYIANPEWGASDLSARIAAPLPVPDVIW